MLPHVVLYHGVLCHELVDLCTHQKFFFLLQIPSDFSTVQLHLMFSLNHQWGFLELLRENLPLLGELSFESLSEEHGVDFHTRKFLHEFVILIFFPFHPFFHLFDLNLVRVDVVISDMLQALLAIVLLCQRLVPLDHFLHLILEQSLLFLQLHIFLLHDDCILKLDLIRFRQSRLIFL